MPLDAVEAAKIVRQVTERPPNFGPLTIQYVERSAPTFRQVWNGLPLTARAGAMRVLGRLLASPLGPAIVVGGGLSWLDYVGTHSRAEVDPKSCFPPRLNLTPRPTPSNFSHYKQTYGVSFEWKGHDFFPHLSSNGVDDRTPATGLGTGGGGFRRVSVPRASGDQPASERSSIQRGISDSDIEELEEKLRYTFRYRELLRTALTPPEARPATRHNKAFEWCGDALLKMGLSAVLLEGRREVDLHRLSTQRIALGMNDTLIKLGRSLGVDRILSKQTQIRDPKIIANAMEALFYALALEVRDLRSVSHFLYGLINPMIEWNPQLEGRTKGGVKGEESSDQIGRVEVVPVEYKPIPLEEVERLIGYSFKNKRTLELVFVDQSAVKSAQSWQTNAEYVWLGKAIIRFCETLFRAYQRDFKPSFGNMLRGLSETEYFQAFITEQLGLHGSIRYGNDLPAYQASRYSLGRANFLRALIGAILADGGFTEAERVYRTLACSPFNRWSEAFHADQRRRTARDNLYRHINWHPPRVSEPPEPIPTPPAREIFTGWGGFGPPSTDNKRNDKKK